MKLVALDMAGTTIDEQGLVYKALRACVEERGVTINDDEFHAAMGRRKDHAIANLLELSGETPTSSDVQAAYERFSQLLEQFYISTPPRPIEGVEKALIEFQELGVRVALTTGFSATVASNILQGLEWSVGGESSMIDAVVTADTVAAGRPAPYMIHSAMQATGVVDVRDVAVAGDTMADLLAGWRSGAKVVAGVLTGETPRSVLEEQPRTHILASVTELPAVVRNIVD